MPRRNKLFYKVKMLSRDKMAGIGCVPLQSNPDNICRRTQPGEIDDKELCSKAGDDCLRKISEEDNLIEKLQAYLVKWWPESFLARDGGTKRNFRLEDFEIVGSAKGRKTVILKAFGEPQKHDEKEKIRRLILNKTDDFDADPTVRSKIAGRILRLRQNRALINSFHVTKHNAEVFVRKYLSLRIDDKLDSNLLDILSLLINFTEISISDSLSVWSACLRPVSRLIDHRTETNAAMWLDHWKRDGVCLSLPRPATFSRSGFALQLVIATISDGAQNRKIERQKSTKFGKCFPYVWTGHLNPLRGAKLDSKASSLSNFTPHLPLLYSEPIFGPLVPKLTTTRSVLDDPGRLFNISEFVHPAFMSVSKGRLREKHPASKKKTSKEDLLLSYTRAGGELRLDEFCLLELPYLQSRFGQGRQLPEVFLQSLAAQIAHGLLTLHLKMKGLAGNLSVKTVQAMRVGFEYLYYRLPFSNEDGFKTYAVPTMGYLWRIVTLQDGAADSVFKNDRVEMVRLRNSWGMQGDAAACFCPRSANVPIQMYSFVRVLEQVELLLSKDEIRGYVNSSKRFREFVVGKESIVKAAEEGKLMYTERAKTTSALPIVSMEWIKSLLSFTETFFPKPAESFFVEQTGTNSQVLLGIPSIPKKKTKYFNDFSEHHLLIFFHSFFNVFEISNDLVPENAYVYDLSEVTK